MKRKSKKVKIGSKKSKFKRSRKRNTSRLNPDQHPRNLYYTDLITYIQKDEHVKKFLKDRYRGFLMGIIDDMDASYSTQLEKDNTLSPSAFIIWYISTGQDIESAKDIISDNKMPTRIKEEMKKLIKQLKEKK